MLVGVFGPESGVIYRSISPSTGLTQEELLDALEAELRAALEARPEAAAVGLGVPCTIDRELGVCVNAVNLPLRNVPLQKLIAARVGLPTFVDNDANAATIAEHRHGAGRGTSNLVMLTIGTGIGGGLILDGRPFRGSRGAGAELGHVVVDLDGPRCQGSCPNHGCIEAIASGTAIGREGEEAAALAPDSALGRAHAAGIRTDGLAVTTLAQRGDPAAIEVLATIGRRLGAALSGLANVFDPDLIVLGGGAMAADELILGPAREEFAARALPPQNRTAIAAAELGPDAGMIGAATMALEELAAGGAG